MSLIDALRYRVRALLGSERHARDAERELRFHLDLEAAQQAHAGATPNDAEFAARRQLGNRTAVAEAMRRAAGLAWLDATRQDLAFALRGMRRAPAFSLVAMATFALGIGGATAIYSVVDAVLLRPLSIARPNRVLELQWTRRTQPADALEPSVLPVSIPQYLRWQRQLRSFSIVAASMGTHYEPLGPPASHTLLSSLGDRAHDVRVAAVSANFFTLAGIAPRLGSGFAGLDDRTAGGLAILSDSLWQHTYDRDPHAIGRTIVLDGRRYEIAGVMPRGFGFPDEAQVWVGLDGPEFGRLSNERTLVLTVFGRVRDALSIDAARAEIRSNFAAASAAEPVLRNYRLLAPTVRNAMVQRASVPLLVMAICVGVLLAIAAANVTNMLLVRATSRHHEIAVRLALGAARSRVVRQLVTESLVLACGGAAAGLGVAFLITRFVVAQHAIALPRRSLIGLDASAVVVCVLLAMVVGILCGALPAASVSRDAVERALRNEATRHSASLRRRRLRDALIAFEVAMSVILLAGTGLLVRSVHDLMELRPGLTADRLLTAGVLPSLPQSDTVAVRQMAATIAARLRALPGASVVSVSSTYPFGGSITFTAGFKTPDSAPGDTSGRYTAISGIDREYFRAIGVRIVRGRAFTDADLARNDVAIVNDAFVQKYFHGRDPIGQRLRGLDARDLEIVGEVESTRTSGMRYAPDPATFLPLGAFGVSELGIVIRVERGNPLRLIPSVENAVHEAAPASTLVDLGTLSTLLYDEAAPQHAYVFLLGGFALAALVVTAVGLFGVISYTVAQRTREIGIRIALGATPNTVRRQVARQGLGLTVAGVAAGAALSLAATRVLRSLLFGVAPGDPMVLVLVAALLVAVALLASWLPARRAARVDPLIAIRTE
jgi:predicted permease